MLVSLLVMKIKTRLFNKYNEVNASNLNCNIIDYSQPNLFASVKKYMCFTPNSFHNYGIHYRESKII